MQLDVNIQQSDVVTLNWVQVKLKSVEDFEGSSIEQIQDELERPIRMDVGCNVTIDMSLDEALQVMDMLKKVVETLQQNVGIQA